MLHAPKMNVSRLVCFFFIGFCDLTYSNEPSKSDKGKVLTRSDCLEVDDVQYTSAVVHWKQLTATGRHNYIILCTGMHYVALENGTVVPAVDSVTRYVPMEMHQLSLTHLQPNCSYSCVVEAEGVGVGMPCYFITNGQKTRTAVGAARVTNVSRFRAGYSHMAASIVLGGVLPMVLIGGCVGLIILCKRCQGYQSRRQQRKKYQRIPPPVFPSGVHTGSSPHGAQASPYHKQHVASPRLPPRDIYANPRRMGHSTVPPHTRPAVTRPLPTVPPHTGPAVTRPLPTVPPHTCPAVTRPPPTISKHPMAHASLPVGIKRDMSREFQLRGIRFKPLPPFPS